MMEMILSRCEWCDEFFEKFTGKTDSEGHQFCGQDCMERAHREWEIEGDDWDRS